MSEMISDKEVGELWRKALNEEGCYSAHTEMALIRKLVEERAFKHQTNCLTDAKLKDQWVKNHFCEMALRDFGIDPATWSEK